MSADAHAPLPVHTRAWRRLRRPAISYADLPDYKAEFPATAEAFGRFLDRLSPSAPPASGAVAAVVVTPWLATPMPWWSVTLALALRRRGRRVLLLWDDTGVMQGVPSARMQDDVIGPVLDRVEALVPVARLGRQRPGPRRDDDAAVAARLAALNEAWQFRGGSPDGAAWFDRRTLARDLATTLRRIRAFASHHELAYVVASGGIWGTSGLFLHAGAEVGFDVSTVDAGQGWLLASNEGVAAQQPDVGTVFRRLWRDDLAGLEPCLAAARAEFDARIGGRDRTAFQAVAASGRERSAGGVLVPMNVDHDTAALGRHVYFTDTTEWILETVEFVLTRSDEPIVVRQHPSERRDLERSRLDVRTRLAERFGREPRVRFVAAEDPVSTYDLLRDAGLIVPFVSTIGIEAAAWGKPVVTAGATYYDDLGFVHSAASRGGYFELLEQGLGGRLPPIEQQQDRAWLCYYLSQCCNRVWSEFTPQPDDFRRWSERDPEALFASEAVEDLVTSIDGRVALAEVRHVRLMRGSERR